MLNTEGKGVIVSRATNKVIGSWFINFGQLGFYSKDRKFKRISKELVQGVRVSENNFKKTSLLNLSRPVISRLLATAGYYLMQPDEVKRSTNPVHPPEMDPDMAAVFWRGSKFYAVRNSDNMISAVINFGAKGPKITSALDAAVTRELTNTLVRGASTPINVGEDDVVLENSTKIDLEDMSVFNVAYVLSPTYSLIPAGYIEQNIRH